MSCQSLCVPPVDTVLTECYVKTLILISKKIVWVQMLPRKQYNLHIYFDAHYRKRPFSRLRLYCTPAGTRLLRHHTFAAYYQYISLKNPGLSVVSDPCLMEKVGFFILLNVY